MNKLPPDVLETLGHLQRGYAQKMLPDEDYFKHFYDALDHAKEDVEKNKGADHMMLLYGRNRDEDVEGDDKWSMTLAMFADWPPKDKYRTMQGLGAKWADDNPNYMLMQIVHVSEGWIADYSKEEGLMDKGPYLPKGVKYPSEREDRKECLMVSSLSMDQRTSYCNLEIIRQQTSEKFKAWGQTWESIYDPKAEVKHPGEMADFLSVNVLMGYFEANAARNTDD